MSSTDPNFLLTIAGAVMAAMFGLLAAVLGWIGSRMHSKMESILETLHQIAGDLHGRINHLDQRVTRVETYQQSVCSSRIHIQGRDHG